MLTLGFPAQPLNRCALSWLPVFQRRRQGDAGLFHGLSSSPAPASSPESFPASLVSSPASFPRTHEQLISFFRLYSSSSRGTSLPPPSPWLLSGIHGSIVLLLPSQENAKGIITYEDPRPHGQSTCCSHEIVPVFSPRDRWLFTPLTIQVKAIGAIASHRLWTIGVVALPHTSHNSPTLGS